MAILNSPFKGCVRHLMIEPVILPDTVLSQARSWRDALLERWTEHGSLVHIGEATLVSPVDGNPQNVLLYLDGIAQLNVRAMTFPKLLSPGGEPIGPGRTIVLSAGRIDVKRDPVTAILLHEVTHALDPVFEEDIRRQDSEMRLTDAFDLYELASEQRAFAAMWTADLQDEVARGEYRNVGVSILRYRDWSAEFKGFLDNAPLDVADQTREHLRRIVVDLKSRQRKCQP